MKRRICLLLTIALLLTTSVRAAELTGRCSIRFFGDSTLHGFSGQVACQPFVLTAEDSFTAEQSSRGTSVRVLVAEMNTDNARRDKKMREMFQAQAYPVIEGLLTALDPQQVMERLGNAADPPKVVPFELKIREISQPVQAQLGELSVSKEKLSFTLEFPLSLASYQLQAPSVLGLIRVADQVRVEVRVELERS